MLELLTEAQQLIEVTVDYGKPESKAASKKGKTAVKRLLARELKRRKRLGKL